MGVNSKASVFSWADEVEKEEEEEAQAQLHRPQKLDPFGSARPREIILEEKGIDWRKLDQELQSSNLRKENQMMENVPRETQSVNGQEQFPARSGRLKENKEPVQNARNVFHQMAFPAVFLERQKQYIDSLVPPLRYPPRNIMALMELQKSHYSDRLHEKQPLSVLESQRERESMNYDNLGGYFSVTEREIESTNYQFTRRHFSVEKYRGQQMEPGNIETMRAWEKKRGDMRSEYGRDYGRKKLSCPPVELQANGRRARCAIKDSNRENINDGFARRGQTTSIMENTGLGGNRNERVARLAIEETEWETIECHNGRRNFGVEMEDPSKRERVLRNTKSRDFGGNCRKRGMASEAGISHYHQRRK